MVDVGKRGMDWHVVGMERGACVGVRDVE